MAVTRYSITIGTQNWFTSIQRERWRGGIPQGCGLGSAWILINLSCWIRIQIRIQVYNLHLNLEVIFYIFVKLSFLTFFFMKKMIIL
jgi:hypothetical protein